MATELISKHTTARQQFDAIAPDHHVAQIDTDAEFHLALGRQARVLGFEVGLDRDPAIHRVDNAGKFGQHAVASRSASRSMIG